MVVAGFVVLCNWTFIIDRFTCFEEHGIWSLLAIWMLLVVAAALGLLSRPLLRVVGLRWIVTHYCLGGHAHTLSPLASQNAISAKGLSGTFQATPAGEEEDEVTVEKRRAQAEAAAQRHALQRCVKELQTLASPVSGAAVTTLSFHPRSPLGAAAEVCCETAQLLLKSSSGSAQSDFVQKGGVVLVLGVIKRALVELSEERRGGGKAPVAALWQATWVLLQVCSGPPLVGGVLVDAQVVRLLYGAVSEVLQSRFVPLSVKECILRNIMWIWFLLCSQDDDTQQQQLQVGPHSQQQQQHRQQQVGEHAGDHITAGTRGSSSLGSSNSSSTTGIRRGSSQAASISRTLLLEAGAIPVIQQQLGMEYGLIPGTFSLALLGCLAQLQSPAVPGVADRVLSSLVAPAPLHGLVLALHFKEFPTERVEQELYGLVDRVGSSSSYVVGVLRILVEEHLVGKFLQALPQRLARLFLCQLLSSRGQEMILDLEAQCVLDVPLALAQVVTLSGVHMALPSTSPSNGVQLLEEQAEGEGEAEGYQQQQQQGGQMSAESSDLVAGAALDQQQEEYYTDMLTCRLLLQHQRLKELVAAYGEELIAAVPPRRAEASGLEAATAGVAIESFTAREGSPAPAGGPCEVSPPVIAAQFTTTAEGEGFRLGGGGSEVIEAVDSLIKYLVDRDVQLQAAKQVCGASFEASSSSYAVSSIASSVSSLDAALQQPDRDGVYASVVQGLVQPHQLPPTAARSAKRTAVCEIEPEVEPDVACVMRKAEVSLERVPPLASHNSSSGRNCNCRGPCSSSSTQLCEVRSSSSSGVKVNGMELGQLLLGSSGTGSIVFQFERYQHRVTGRQFKKIKQSSQLLKLLLGKAVEASGAQEPIRVLSIPQFTPRANWWVVQCLAQWCERRQLPVGLKPRQVAQLWIAAEVLQVDELRAACEDALSKGFSQDLKLLAIALELCCRHPLSSSRLQALGVQALMKGLGSTWSTAAVHDVFVQYRQVLEAGLHMELRDRIVALCMLNLGADG